MPLGWMSEPWRTVEIGQGQHCEQVHQGLVEQGQFDLGELPRIRADLALWNGI